MEMKFNSDLVCVYGTLTAPYNVTIAGEHGDDLIGRGNTLEEAILSLADGIKNARAFAISKPAIPDFKRGIDISAWRESVNAALVPEKPSVGRIVWYYPVTGEVDAHKGGPMPAMVTRVVDQYTVNLHVFLDTPGTRFVPTVDYRCTSSPGCWNWPKKQD